MALQFRDVLPGKRRRSSHGERQHLIELPASTIARPPKPHGPIEPLRVDTDGLCCDCDRRWAAQPDDTDAPNARRGRDRGDGVVAHSAVAGTTRIWRSSPSPSLRLDSPGISAIAM